MGQLIYASKDYINNAYESDRNKVYTALIKRIKNEIKQIKPTPLFNSNIIFQEERNNDVLLPIRSLLKDLQFYESSSVRRFRLKDEFEKKIQREVEKKMEKLKRGKMWDSGKTKEKKRGKKQKKQKSI